MYKEAYGSLAWTLASYIRSYYKKKTGKMNQSKERLIVGFLERKYTSCVSLCGFVLKWQGKFVRCKVLNVEHAREGNIIWIVCYVVSFCLCGNVVWKIGFDRAKGRKRHYKHRNIAVKFYFYVVSFQIQILLTRSEVCSKTRLESCSHSSFSFASFWVYKWW